MNEKVRVRFAPSPTGSLHIGSLRTAIFNWLFARHYGGKFIIRIEDTDTARSRDEYTRQIFDDMHWLGLDWDEEPFYQSRNIELHVNLVSRLISSGKAYHCYCSPEELAKKRAEAEKNKVSYWFDRVCLNLSESDPKRKIRPPVVRFLVPEGRTTYTDLVHGEITVNNKEIDDFILLRSDGTPTYQVAVVGDDHTMKITHVIRGDDHISNTPKQLLLYRALGFESPSFAHIPLIFGMNKKKLSKRYGAVSISDFRQKGFLPECIINFLSLLGWSPSSDEELLSRDELISLFGLDGITPKNAVFDYQKMAWMNKHYISQKSEEYLFPLVLPVLESTRICSKEEAVNRKPYVMNIIRMLKHRVRTLSDFAEFGSYFFQDPTNFDESAVKKYWKTETKEQLRELKEVLLKITDFTAEKIEQALRGLADERQKKAKEYIHATRVALTGLGNSPGLFEVIALLGKETTLRRLERAILYMEKYGIHN